MLIKGFYIYALNNSVIDRQPALRIFCFVARSPYGPDLNVWGEAAVSIQKQIGIPQSHVARLKLVVLVVTLGRPSTLGLRYDIHDVKFARYYIRVLMSGRECHRSSITLHSVQDIAFNSRLASSIFSRQTMANFWSYIAGTKNLGEYVLIYILTQLISTFASFALAWCDERTLSQRSQPSQSRVLVAYKTG